MLGAGHVRQEPVGVVAAIVPWNVPQFTPMLKLAPALLAGCTVVAKPSPETPLDAYLLAELARGGGLPDGVVNIVPAGREVGEHLVAPPRRRQGRLHRLHRRRAHDRARSAASSSSASRLELGGKSAAIILDDADLGATVEGLKLAVADEQRPGVRRPDPHPRVPPPLRRGRRRPRRRWSAGSPSATRPTRPPRSAPWSPSASRSASRRYIALGQEEGAKLVAGGNGRPDGIDRGWYVAADRVRRRRQRHAHRPRGDLRAGARPSSPTTTRTTPSASPTTPTTASAARSGRPTPTHGVDVARRIRTGTCGVNMYTLDPNTPFGGYKNSGLGREFGPEGLLDYLEHKSIPHPA